MKNVIFVGTEVPSSVVANGIVPLTAIQRKYNRCNANSKVDLVGNAVAIETNGKCNRARYNAIARVTFSAPVAGNVQLSLYQDGVLIPFTTVLETITTATTEFRTITIPVSILAKCCGTTGITIVNTGTVAITVQSASIVAIEV